MGLDDNTENWNKENFTRTFKKAKNFEAVGETSSRFEQPSLPKKCSFKLIASCSQNDFFDDPNDQWTTFRKKFILNDDNLTDADIFNELLELCSWYDPTDESDRDNDDDDDMDEEIEMIKRNFHAELTYSSPQQQPKPRNTSLTMRRSSSFLSLSSLRLNSSTNLCKRRQPDGPNSSSDLSCPNKRPYTPFQHRRSSMNLDEAISCAAQNLEVDFPSFAITSPKPTAKPSTLERKNSDFWGEMDSVTF